ncbi:YrvL family regulatory protein [Vagococcus sp. PNs007]|uniref:YrvL family regulatory protein n=1 Tax=Vagococcus proximus TaxID=2991417 RepID=A0ABT5X3E4_9ENTE|nr:YrvL family regulatory protein [Vagococcus proximus]MDF0480493.1 YrvL family regulatory protein [Vagococcus proximus]
MKNKLKGGLGIVLIVFIIAIFGMLLVGAIGGLLKLLGIQTVSTMSLIGFLLLYIAITWTLDAILDVTIRASCRAFQVPVNKGFFFFIVSDFLLEILVLKVLDSLMTSIVVPDATAILFATCGTVLTVLIEKKEGEWVHVES